MQEYKFMQEYVQACIWGYVISQGGIRDNK